MARLARSASCWKRGNPRLKSPSGSSANEENLPTRKPRPSGENGRKAIPCSSQKGSTSASGSRVHSDSSDGEARRAGGAAAVGGQVGDEADLRGQHRPLAVALGQRAADELLVGEGAVDVGGVDQGHAEVERLADHGDRRRVVTRRLRVV